MKSKILGLIGLVLLSGSIGARADVVFIDSTFNLADYSASPTFSSDPGASIAYSSRQIRCELPQHFLVRRLAPWPKDSPTRRSPTIRSRRVRSPRSMRR